MQGPSNPLSHISCWAFLSMLGALRDCGDCISLCSFLMYPSTFCLHVRNSGAEIMFIVASCSMRYLLIPKKMLFTLWMVRESIFSPDFYDEHAHQWIQKLWHITIEGSVPLSKFCMLFSPCLKQVHSKLSRLPRIFRHPVFSNCKRQPNDYSAQTCSY